jgi:hypothetical protein
MQSGILTKMCGFKWKRCVVDLTTDISARINSKNKRALPECPQGVPRGKARSLYMSLKYETLSVNVPLDTFLAALETLGERNYYADN